MRYIKYYNRINPMFEPLSKTMTLSFPAWIWPWYKNLFRYDQLLVSISLISYGVILARWKNFYSKINAGEKLFLITMLTQLVCWFLVAPDPRFVYGPLFFGIFMIISRLHFLEAGLLFNSLRNSILILSVVVLGYTLQKIILNPDYRNWIQPKPLPSPPIKKIVVDGLELHIPEKILNNWNARCYDISLPCIYKLDPRVEARGKSIGQGFRISKNKSLKEVEGEYKITE